MKKRVIDLTAEELDRLAGEAWFEASRAALRAGAPVVGRRGDEIVKTYPDGRKVSEGPAAPLVEVDLVLNKGSDKRAKSTSTKVATEMASKSARRAGR